MHLAFFCLNLLLVYYLNSYFIPTGHIDYHSCSQQSDSASEVIRHAGAI